jgi:pimeloyl-ACP methyl ester carboxylesterase
MMERRIRTSVLALLGLLTAGCVIDDAEVATDAAEQRELRMVLLCQQGLSDRTLGWDKGLFALCESVEEAGFTLVRDGDYPAFGALDGSGAYAALFDNLDDNGDGVVDHDDSPAAIHLVGFSWGGIVVTQLADALLHDDRVAPSRRGVMGMVLLDPYQPWTRPTIPANVLDAWIYRQSETLSSDCSTTVSFGFGFNASIPETESEMGWCTDYDLDAVFEDVGHCEVPYLATQAAFVNLTEHDDYLPWDHHAEPCLDAN